MNPAATTKAKEAFTLIELLVITAAVAVLWILLIQPIYSPAKVKAPLIACVNNLRQISLSYILWASANTNLLPWEVSTNSGGSLELVANGNAADHFLPLATTLRNPAVLACPTDRAKRSVNSYAGFSNTNLSYFVSLDAALTTTPNPALSILAGDRHLSFSNRPVPPGRFVTTNFDALGWLPGFHGSSAVPSGGLAFVDGHAEIVKSANLPAIFRRQGIATNRLVLP